MSVKNLPYDYYSLPYCRPDKIVSSAENLGEVLRGDRIENSPYQVGTGQAAEGSWLMPVESWLPRRGRQVLWGGCRQMGRLPPAAAALGNPTGSARPWSTPPCAGQIPRGPALQGAVPHRLAEQGAGEGVQKQDWGRVPRQHVRVRVRAAWAARWEGGKG